MGFYVNVFVVAHIVVDYGFLKWIEGICCVLCLVLKIQYLLDSWRSMLKTQSSRQLPSA